MKVRKIPRGTFFIGGLACVALCLPLTTLAMQLLGRRFGLLRADASIPLLALVFAGLPAFLTGGGVARLVAHRLAEEPSGHAWTTAAAPMAIAGVGLLLLTAVPTGGLPEKPAQWWPLGVAGLLAGFVTGVAIALLVGPRTLRYRRRMEGQA